MGLRRAMRLFRPLPPPPHAALWRPPGARRRRRSPPLVLLVPLAGFCWYRSDWEHWEHWEALGGARRFASAAAAGLRISLDYWWTEHVTLRGEGQDSPAQAREWSGCHRRAGERLRAAAERCGGLYLKLGQGLISMEHVLPPEIPPALGPLLQSAPTHPPRQVERVFLEDFGVPPSRLFRHFDPVPVAAASLAQVHRATRHDGTPVAVKVQHPGLRERFEGDIRALELLLRLVGVLHPQFSLAWVLQDLKGRLAQELDFELEGRNAERCARDLRHLPHLSVPRVHWDTSSKRVLTLDWCDGVPVSDTEGLRGMGLGLRDTAEKLIGLFAEQIFHTGFIHADPHPGNVLVRRGPDGSAQLVLLDHGLYEQLPRRDRLALCQLWRAIVLRDQRGMERHARELGVTDWRLLSELLLQRPLRSRLSDALSREERDYMRDVTSRRFERVAGVLRALPRPLLLVLRNINATRSIHRRLGCPAPRAARMAQSAVRGCVLVQDPHSPWGRRALGWIRGVWERIKFELALRLDALQLGVSAAALRLLGVWGLLPHGEELGGELRA